MITKIASNLMKFPVQQGERQTHPQTLVLSDLDWAEKSLGDWRHPAEVLTPLGVYEGGFLKGGLPELKSEG